MFEDRKQVANEDVSGFEQVEQMRESLYKPSGYKGKHSEGDSGTYHPAIHSYQRVPNSLPI